MSLESEEKIKLLDEYIEVLKHELFFLMAERKPENESASTHNVITIKRELDKAIQQKMSYARFITGISTMA